jgi:hypothetical protein
MEQLGYNSSPSLWDAFLHADGALACLVEISEPISTYAGVEDGVVQASRTRTLIEVHDVSVELRLFACECAQHVLYLFEQERPEDDVPRRAIRIGRDRAYGRAAASELQFVLRTASDATSLAPLSSAAKAAALSAFSTAEEAPQDAAVLAVWWAGLAIDGKNYQSGTENAWQRGRFARTLRVPESRAP